MEFVSEEERFAFHLLDLANEHAKKEGLNKTSQRIERLINKKRAGKTCQLKEYGFIIEFYVAELMEKFPDSGRSIAQIEKLIIDHAPILAAGRLNWDIQKGDWEADEFQEMMATAELIADRARNTDDSRVKILLIGLSLIIQYERFTSFAKGMIEALVLPEQMKDELKKQGKTQELKDMRKSIRGIQEENLSVDSQVKGNRSDVCHVRNAFAHAHFRFVDDQTIKLWDVSDRKITFESNFKVDELRHLANSFNQKLAFIQVYAYLLVATSGLLRCLKD